MRALLECNTILNSNSLRYAIPEEDFHIGVGCYEWPKKMTEIIKEANFKANQEHKGFEQALKAQRVAFSQKLFDYQKQLESYDTKNEINKRDQLAAEVRALVTFSLPLLQTDLV